MIGHRCLVFALALAGCCATATVATAEEKPLSRILFGSCARQDSPQPIWESIVAARPDLFVLLGDNIYGDSEDVGVLRKKYNQLGAKPGFKKLRATCPLLATWDDHDYGANDAGAEYPSKAASQKLFNDFFDVPQDSPRRQRKGIYAAHMFGPRGQRVQVVLLDTRYFRSPLRAWRQGQRPKGRGPYRPHEADRKDVTILGAAQWRWLEEQLQQPADVRIIASSIQVVAREHGWETWGNFPAERQRLFDLLAKTRAGSVIFISGDRHHGEISRIDGDESGVGYPLYDVTSSSLNQPGSGANKHEPNRHRLGENYLPINFGSIVIDWSKSQPAIALSIHDGQGKTVRQQATTLAQLQAD